MKGLLNVLIFIVAIFLVTTATTKAFGWIGGIAGFLLVILFSAIILRAKILFIIGQSKYAKCHADGLKLMEKAYKTGKLSPQASLMYAYLVLRDGQLENAEKLINQITYLKKRELGKEHMMVAKTNQALIMWKKGELKEAILSLEEMYDGGYKSTTFYGTLGYFYILDDQLTKAMEFNTEAYEYNSTNMIIEDNLASTYMLMADYDKAEEMYKKLFEQNPQFIEPYYNYGLLMEKRGNRQDAIDYYNKALTYPEKYLSTISHEQVRAAVERVEQIK